MGISGVPVRKTWWARPLKATAVLLYCVGLRSEYMWDIFIPLMSQASEAASQHLSVDTLSSCSGISEFEYDLPQPSSN